MKVVEGQIEVCDTCINSLGYEVAWQETWHENSVEPEWEYGIAAHMPIQWKGGRHVVAYSDRIGAEERAAKLHGWVARRTKAGPWLPVEPVQVEPETKGKSDV